MSEVRSHISYPVSTVDTSYFRSALREGSGERATSDNARFIALSLCRVLGVPHEKKKSPEQMPRALSAFGLSLKERCVEIKLVTYACIQLVDQADP